MITRFDRLLEGSTMVHNGLPGMEAPQHPRQEETDLQEAPKGLPKASPVVDNHGAEEKPFGAKPMLSTRISTGASILRKKKLIVRRFAKYGSFSHWLPPCFLTIQNGMVIRCHLPSNSA